PVLRLRSTGPGMNGEEGVPHVVRPLKHVAELECGKRAACCFDLIAPLLRHGLVSLGLEKFRQLLEVADSCSKAPPRLRPRLQGVDLVDYFARRVCIVPEVRLRHARLQLLNSIFLCGDVKETSPALRACWSSRRVGSPLRSSISFFHIDLEPQAN